jgi:hypothetical protein
LLAVGSKISPVFVSFGRTEEPEYSPPTTSTRPSGSRLEAKYCRWRLMEGSVDQVPWVA